MVLKNESINGSTVLGGDFFQTRGKQRSNTAVSPFTWREIQILSFHLNCSLLEEIAGARSWLSGLFMLAD